MDFQQDRQSLGGRTPPFREHRPPFRGQRLSPPSPRVAHPSALFSQGHNSVGCGAPWPCRERKINQCVGAWLMIGPCQSYGAHHGLAHRGRGNVRSYRLFAVQRQSVAANLRRGFSRLEFANAFPVVAPEGLHASKSSNGFAATDRVRQTLDKSGRHRGPRTVLASALAIAELYRQAS